jgi:hypothetical protein
MATSGPEQFFDPIQPEGDDECKEILWHYTDADGLLGILNSRRIRATHVAHLNDPSELVHGEELAVSVASDLANSLAKDSGNDIAIAALTRFRLNWGTIRLSASWEIFAASFCNDQGNRLSQWRGYGGAGSGYSLGFKRVAISIEDYPHLLVQVRYPEDPNTEKLRSSFDAIVAAVQLSVAAGAERESVIALALAKLNIVAQVFALKVKHAGFSEENEWRLVAIPGIATGKGNPRIQYRPSNRGIVPYVALPIGDASTRRLPLHMIKVGPSNNPGASVRAVKELLKSLKYPDADSLVEHSGIPYRG